MHDRSNPAIMDGYRNALPTVARVQSIPGYWQHYIRGVRIKQRERGQ